MTAAAPPDGEVFGPLSRLVRLAGVTVGCIASLAQLTRAFVVMEGSGLWPWYAGFGAAYLALFALAMLRRPRRLWRAHAVLVVQCLLVLALLVVEPENDFMTGLFVPLAFEAALLFEGSTVWRWVGALAALTIGSLVVFYGPLSGVALALISLAAEVVFAAYVVVVRDIEGERRQSQVMLEELQRAHGRLQAYAGQAGELAALGERERVARELNDSAARTIHAVLDASRIARAMLGDAGDHTVGGADDEAAGDPARPACDARPSAAALLASLQADTQGALAQMRGLIAELRPRSEASATRAQGGGAAAET